MCRVMWAGCGFFLLWWGFCDLWFVPWVDPCYLILQNLNYFVQEKRSAIWSIFDIVYNTLRIKFLIFSIHGQTYCWTWCCNKYLFSLLLLLAVCWVNLPCQCWMKMHKVAYDSLLKIVHASQHLSPLTFLQHYPTLLLMHCIPNSS